MMSHSCVSNVSAESKEYVPFSKCSVGVCNMQRRHGSPLCTEHTDEFFVYCSKTTSSSSAYYDYYDKFDYFCRFGGISSSSGGGGGGGAVAYTQNHTALPFLNQNGSDADGGVEGVKDVRSRKRKVEVDGNEGVGSDKISSSSPPLPWSLASLFAPSSILPEQKQLQAATKLVADKFAAHLLAKLNELESQNNDVLEMDVDNNGTRSSSEDLDKSDQVAIIKKLIKRTPLIAEEARKLHCKSHGLLLQEYATTREVKKYLETLRLNTVTGLPRAIHPLVKLVREFPLQSGPSIFHVSFLSLTSLGYEPKVVVEMVKAALRNISVKEPTIKTTITAELQEPEVPLDRLLFFLGDALLLSLETAVPNYVNLAATPSHINELFDFCRQLASELQESLLLLGETKKKQVDVFLERDKSSLGTHGLTLADANKAILEGVKAQKKAINEDNREAIALDEKLRRECSGKFFPGYAQITSILSSTTVPLITRSIYGFIEKGLGDKSKVYEVLQSIYHLYSEEYNTLRSGPTPYAKLVSLLSGLVPFESSSRSSSTVDTVSTVRQEMVDFVERMSTLLAYLGMRVIVKYEDKNNKEHKLGFFFTGLSKVDRLVPSIEFKQILLVGTEAPSTIATIEETDFMCARGMTLDVNKHLGPYSNAYVYELKRFTGEAGRGVASITSKNRPMLTYVTEKVHGDSYMTMKTGPSKDSNGNDVYQTSTCKGRLTEASFGSPGLGTGDNAIVMRNKGIHFVNGIAFERSLARQVRQRPLLRGVSSDGHLQG
jgi:hypothetical protein